LESSAQAEKRLAVLERKKGGTYLVRLNTGERISIDKAPFTITRVDQQGSVIHTRVYTKQGGGLMLKTGGEKGEKITSRGNSIPDFITTVNTKNPTLLTVPCPGWPFEEIFSSTPLKRSPYDEAFDDDFQ